MISRPSGDQHLALRGVVGADEKPRARALAFAGGADERHVLAARHPERQVAEHPGARLVCEPDATELQGRDSWSGARVLG